LYYDTFVRKDPPFVMEQRRQRLEESQARNNTEIIDYFSQLMTTTPPDLNPAFKLTIFGQVHTHVIKSLAWSGACPIEEDLLRVFEAEVRPRHGCQLDNAAKSCYDFWWRLSHWDINSGCGPCLFRACGWRYEDADGRVLEKNETVHILRGLYSLTFCLEGSGVFVHSAPHPLGPWTFEGNIGCTNGTKAHHSPLTKGCWALDHQRSITHSQPSAIIQTEDGNFIYAGDRWQQAPDKIKAHDPQVWLPLQFAGDRILPLRMVNTFIVH
jgi:hypothetical protein